jgi:hypothetical protein
MLISMKAQHAIDAMEAGLSFTDRQRALRVVIINQDPARNF